MLITILLIIHVIGVIIWIGGVAFVTMVIFPMMYSTEGSLDKALLFQGVEHQFAGIVRWLIGIVGATGLYILYVEYGFAILLERRGVGILIMLIVWLLYTTIILSERKIFGKIFANPERINMNKALSTINFMHWVLLLISFSAVAAGIWFSHRG